MFKDQDICGSSLVTCSQTTPSGRFKNLRPGRNLPCTEIVFTIHLVCDRLSDSSLRQGIHRRPKDRLPNRGVEGILSGERLLESPALRRA